MASSLITSQRHPNSRTDVPFKLVGSSSSPASSSSGDTNNNSNSKKKWSNWIPIFVALVVIAEISFLGRLDIAKNSDLVNSWADSFYQFTTSPWLPTTTIHSDGGGENGDGGAKIEEESCEEWLEKEDSVVYSRDFETEPVYVTGAEQGEFRVSNDQLQPQKEWKTCAVGCKFGYDSNKKPDAAFGLLQGGVASVLRSMESAKYYHENDLDIARRKGYNIVMTTSLSSDVPVGYFSWAEYDIMAPLEPKTERALAAAFISNCGARNFRLQALEGLEKANIKIDSYGSCHRNRDGKVDKVVALRRYKFSLAFENSNEEDYVTEKFFQSLVAGSIPVVVGAPNIQDFAPSPGSILHIKKLEDIDTVAKTMKYLAENPGAYNESLRWKFEGPSDSFKALVDMAAVHSSCRLCIHLAIKLRETEEKKPEFKKRPCKCSSGSETVYHVYVSERGRFKMVSLFLRSGNLTMEALESAVLSKFKSINHVPVWKPERPEKIRGGDELKVYRIYPLGITQRQALYTFRLNANSEFRNHIEKNPCPKFEVIFL